MNVFVRLLVLISFFYTGKAIAQPRDAILLTNAAKTEVEKKIMEASRNITSLQCKFTEEKSSVLLTHKSVSKGILLYKTPSSLRWEYTHPAVLTLILHQDKVSIRNGKGESLGSGKMFKQLAYFIISTVNGNGLRDNKDFTVDYYRIQQDKSVLWVKLTPVSKQLKAVYASIEIKISTKDYLATEIILNELSGDKTDILLSDKTLNGAIASSQFSTD
ncbi:MAG: outer membrane lipoprotein carrier protein LolA [Bacteroidales bacterium]|jgi:outer membrane lipoprotein-sorting protein|nr:outer membrane lipoprotein carrier protein LolA [Bacteroidales bacterium]